MRMTAVATQAMSPAPAAAPSRVVPCDAAIRVTPVEDSRAQREFVELPFRLYADDPCWVPPVRREERKFLSQANPYLRDNPTRLFLARKGREVVGRIAATVCQGHNEHWGEATGFFGYFECDGEPATAAALVEAASCFLVQQGMEVIRGPFNLTTNHTCGLLIEGFDGPPLIDMTYNPPGYAALLEAQGFVKAKDLVAFWLDLQAESPERDALARVAREAPPSYRVREMCIKGRGLVRDMKIFDDIYHHAWRKNWGFVPLEPPELDFLLERLRPAMTPELAYVGEVDGRPAGVFLAIPDFNQVLPLLKGRLTPLGLLRVAWARRRIDVARWLLGGIHEDYRGTPLAALLLHSLLEGAREHGYRGIEGSWVLEDNVPTHRFLNKNGMQIYRRYRIYERRLGLRGLS